MLDTKQDIAELLKTQRQNLGLSLDEIFERTRIDPEFLKAFEAGNFDVLPRVYARLFLRTYARELNLDAQDILLCFEKNVVPHAHTPVTVEPPVARGTSLKLSISLVACALIVVAIIALNREKKAEFTAPLDTTSPQPSVVEPQPSPAEIQPVPKDSAASRRSPQQIDSPIPAQNNTSPPARATPPRSEDHAAQSPSENRETPPAVPERAARAGSETRPSEDVIATYNLPLPVIVADEDSLILSGFTRETLYLHIRADGRDLFFGVLPAGSEQRWQARDHFRIHVERAGAILFSLQDQPLESASPPDRGLRLTISRSLIRVEELDNARAGP